MSCTGALYCVALGQQWPQASPGLRHPFSEPAEWVRKARLGVCNGPMLSGWCPVWWCLSVFSWDDFSLARGSFCVHH